MVLESFIHSLGITRKNRYFDDCLQEARLALATLDSGATPAYQRQAVKWAIYNFLSKQLTEDYRVFKVRFAVDNMDMEDRIIERIAQRSEYKQLTIDMTPFERLVYVLTVSSPLDQQQIADTLEVSERTIRRTLAAAREKLTWRDKEMRDAEAEEKRLRNRAKRLNREESPATPPATRVKTERKRKKNFVSRRGKQITSFGDGLFIPAHQDEAEKGQ